MKMDITNMRKKKADCKVPISSAKNQTDCNSHATGQFSTRSQWGISHFRLQCKQKVTELISIYLNTQLLLPIWEDKIKVMVDFRAGCYEKGHGARH